MEFEISVGEVEKKCGKLSKFKDWNEKNSVRNFDSWLWCAGGVIVDKKREDIMGESGFLDFQTEMGLLQKEYGETLTRLRGEHEKKIGKIKNKYYKRGISGEVSEFLWFGNVGHVINQMKKEFSPEFYEKEEDVTITVKKGRFDLNELKNLKLDVDVSRKKPQPLIPDEDA